MKFYTLSDHSNDSFRRTDGFSRGSGIFAQFFKEHYVKLNNFLALLKSNLAFFLGVSGIS